MINEWALRPHPDNPRVEPLRDADTDMKLWLWLCENTATVSMRASVAEYRSGEAERLARKLTAEVQPLPGTYVHLKRPKKIRLD